MATRSIAVTTTDGSDTTTTRFNYINPDATDEQLYTAFTNIFTNLSTNTFISIQVTNSYMLETPGATAATTKTPLITRR